MAGIPDPTIDLDWSGYVGPIHEHFALNARQHPDRTCIVETKGSETPERRFTYRQIFEAANVLAHFLHSTGVTNGDVVMIWAHRSVDLVIAFMGTLACGATISVLDPLYPPTRQKMYLEVAQPRALVNLGTATDEAGLLAPVVRRYIEDELQLKAEVPALRIRDDGVLTGTESGEEDIFSRVRGKASAPPDVLVGPDSAPTLSFTSGSEGRPKGVLGRHYSLTRYYTWMAKRFGLSAESRFTLLSGIAHDPVQRDIFTPMFLGAQLLVPSKEDIQHEKLAEWMSLYSPTVTHLTPAMGQILVGGASAKFPQLDRAFFVGDVLTTRDCRSLRALAENVNIVNMYGTTETQRAVSYYEIPSRAKDSGYLDKLKDTVPAGQGMQNVQLLVVNREDRTKMCGVGEVGEVYVRAAGLAEGYRLDQNRMDTTLNETKFLENWFVNPKKWVEEDRQKDRGEPWRKYYKGPRDRLYRTGDLGRYLPSGEVEVTGRVDDQVKIRGFRIELNDIDSNLSQNAMIRDCKTLVRRDRNEEQMLVSYIVPELKVWAQWLKDNGLQDVEEEGVVIGPTKVYPRRFRRMQIEVRDHLQRLLPRNAVSSHFIVLDKLPLNPNGKVDKPNLPFPDIVEQTDEASDADRERWELMTETERTVATKWAELLPGINPQTIHLDSNWADLGGHSLIAQKMLLKIRKELGVDVPISGFYSNPSLAGFCRLVGKQLGLADGPVQEGTTDAEGLEYAKSLEFLVQQLLAKYQTADADLLAKADGLTVFLTGATGFLGAYIIRDIFERPRPIRLIAHVRSARDAAAGLERLQRSLQAYGLWRDEWTARLNCVVGDLAKPQLGMADDEWNKLAGQVDVVIHNGANVHWIKTYSDMVASNVLSTIDAMRLCSQGRPKTFCFVSSTSVLDTDHYVQLSEKQIRTGELAVMEEDDMEGSRKGLATGYGQTKWVSEQLVREAGKRGLLGSVVRPGYILGDSGTGVCNTDDFLIRMLKGCVQLSLRPRIVNTVNAVPVNHVSRVVVAAALNPIPDGVHVVHVTGHPRLRMNEYLSLLEYYGYKVSEVSYDRWKAELEAYITAGGQEKDQEQNALMPLYHFCINDLPLASRAPELDDRNAVRVLKADAERWTVTDESVGYGISREVVGRYLRYLAETKFVALPTRRGRPLPEVHLSEEQKQALGAVGGRGGTAATLA